MESRIYVFYTFGQRFDSWRRINPFRIARFRPDFEKIISRQNRALRPLTGHFLPPHWHFHFFYNHSRRRRLAPHAFSDAILLLGNLHTPIDVLKHLRAPNLHRHPHPTPPLPKISTHPHNTHIETNISPPPGIIPNDLPHTFYLFEITLGHFFSPSGDQMTAVGHHNRVSRRVWHAERHGLGGGP